MSISKNDACSINPVIRLLIFMIPFNQGISYLSDLGFQYLLKDDFQLPPA